MSSLGSAMIAALMMIVWRWQIVPVILLIITHCQVFWIVFVQVSEYGQLVFVIVLEILECWCLGGVVVGDMAI